MLSWLAEFELGQTDHQTDQWDAEIARDSKPGGRMPRVLDRVQRRRSTQATYDSQGKLVEIHKKFPLDLGDRPTEDSQQ